MLIKVCICSMEHLYTFECNMKILIVLKLYFMYTNEENIFIMNTCSEIIMNAAFLLSVSFVKLDDVLLIGNLYEP